MLIYYFLASTPQDVFLQYGALGAITLLLILAVSKLFQQQIKAHERDIARADRAETELKELNKVAREQLVVELTRAADALGRATEILSELRHDRSR